MLQCYVDESGNNQGSVMVMLGVIADDATWADFSSEWQECLDMRPQMEALHMTDLMWRESDESKERAARFYRIFCDHVKGTVVITVPLADYRDVFGSSGPLFKNPYFFLFFVFMRTCKRECEAMGLKGKMEFIFDEQTGVISTLAEGWNYFREHSSSTSELLGDFPAFKNDKIVLPLQASDLMAWIFRRVLSDDLDGKPRISLPWGFRDNVRYFRISYDRDMLLADHALINA